MAIIEDIERRLLNWCEWRLGGRSGGLGFASVNILSIVRGGNGSAAIVQSDEPVETDAAVRALPDDIRAAVEVWYLVGHVGASEKARRLGCCSQTLYRRRDEAHRLISIWLSSRASERRYARERGLSVTT